jgi:histidinol-phosphate aminotransferase
VAARRAVRASVENAVEYLPVESRETIAERLGVPPEQVAKLDANENPYGPPPAVIAALASLPDLHLYPDPDQRRARAALADYTGMPAERILLGNGSDELIDLLLLVTIEPGDEVVVPVPSFGVYLSRPPLFGARVITVPRREDFDLDLETIEDAITPRTKLLFLASPNNPTGNLVTPQQLSRLLRTGILVVLDEAYYEFAGQTLATFRARVRESRDPPDVQQMGRARWAPHRLRHLPSPSRGSFVACQAAVQCQHCSTSRGRGCAG